MHRALYSVLLLPLAACGATGPRVVHADADVRAPLFSSLAALEGQWVLEDDGPETLVTEFKVTSGGNVVREIMMKGTPNEMTNVYQLDGNGVTMWHFCSIGNTPRMHAAGMDGDRMVFELEDVIDLKAADDHYMGGLTLVWVDENTIEQHWSNLSAGEVEHGMVMRLTRR